MNICNLFFSIFILLKKRNCAYVSWLLSKICRRQEFNCYFVFIGHNKGLAKEWNNIERMKWSLKLVERTNGNNTINCIYIHDYLFVYDYYGFETIVNIIRKEMAFGIPVHIAN